MCTYVYVYVDVSRNTKRVLGSWCSGICRVLTIWLYVGMCMCQCVCMRSVTDSAVIDTHETEIAFMFVPIATCKMIENRWNGFPVVNRYKKPLKTVWTSSIVLQVAVPYKFSIPTWGNTGRVYACVYLCVFVRVCVYTHTHTHTHTRTYTHTHIHACMHTNMHAYIHTYTHKNACVGMPARS